MLWPGWWWWLDSETRGRMKTKLNDTDCLILSLLSFFWFVLFGILYYFASNIFILAIGFLCCITSIGGYLLIGGMSALEPEAEQFHADRDNTGWSPVGTGKRSVVRAK